MPKTSPWGRVAAAALALLVVIAGVFVFRSGRDHQDGTRREASSPADHKRPLRILFIGNSYTYVGDLPGALQALAAAGKETPVESRSIVAGGATLQHHWDTGAAAAIRDSEWDYVVLQEQSLTPLPSVGRDTLFFPYVRKFDEAIRARGARMLLYMTWRRAGPGVAQEEWTKPYLDIARELGARVAPAGLAVERLLAQKPDFPFYSDDGSHPSPAGTYLVACTFYAALFHKSPVGLPPSVRTSEGNVDAVSAEVAPLVQKVSWEAVQEAESRISSGGGTPK